MEINSILDRLWAKYKFKVTCATDGRGYFLLANVNGTILDFFKYCGEYPARRLKLYIHDVLAALKTLHHTR